MPRHARKTSSTQTYHVVIKGADRHFLFEEPKDYLKFLDILEEYKIECKFELFAYCLMSNHVHLLIHTPETPLATIFRKINTKYAVWFNLKYDRTGYVLDGRYYSEPVDTIKYLFTVTRYIHLNPMKAGLEKAPGASYPWSSFSDYQKKTPGLTDKALMIELFGGMDAFLSFHKTICNDDDCIDIHNWRKRIPDDVAKNIILETCNCESIMDFQNFSTVQRNMYIKTLHEKGISIRQLNRLTGTPRGVIEKAIG